MTANKANPLEELTAQHSELQQLLWQDLKQRLSGQTEDNHLQKVLSMLCNHSPNTDLAAWEPERLNETDGNEAGTSSLGMISDEPTVPPLSDEHRQMLCEAVAPHSRGITESDIAAAMLRTCSDEHPDLVVRLREFLDRDLY